MHIRPVSHAQLLAVLMVVIVYVTGTLHTYLIPLMSWQYLLYLQLLTPSDKPKRNLTIQYEEQLKKLRNELDKKVTVPSYTIQLVLT